MSRPLPTCWPYQGERRTRERGQALVELAILLPVIVGVLLWSRDFATAFHYRHTVLQAARFAAWSALQEPSSRARSRPSLRRIAEETRTRILAGLPGELRIEERSSLEGVPGGGLLGLAIERLGLSPEGKFTARVRLPLDRLLQNPAFAGRQLEEHRTVVGRTWRAPDTASVREVVARQHLGGASRWLGPALAIVHLDAVRVNLDALPKRAP